MTLFRETVVLIQKELKLEWRQKYAISGIFLYVLSTVYIVYISNPNIKAPIWNTLFWIIILFASINAVVKSFVQENNNRQLYYYQLANPIAVLLAKMIYNTLLLLLLSLLTFAFFSFISGNPVKDYGLFSITLFLGSLGFGVTFTFLSAIAAKAKNSATLMAIMGFPIIIPILLELLKLSAGGLRLLQDTDVQTDMLILLAIDGILFGLALLLFPFLWKD